MFGNMMGKLQEAQEKMKEVQERLDSVSVKGEASNGEIQIIVSASKQIRDVKIAPSIVERGDAEEIEDQLLLALQQAFQKADNVAKSESGDLMKGVLPNIPGLNL